MWNEQMGTRTLTWQVIESHAASDRRPVANAGACSFSGQQRFVEACAKGNQRQSLKAYVDAGGFIFAENCLRRRRAFDREFRALMQGAISRQPAPVRYRPIIRFGLRKRRSLPDPAETPLEGPEQLLPHERGLLSRRAFGVLLGAWANPASDGRLPQTVVQATASIGRWRLGPMCWRMPPVAELRDKLDVPQPRRQRSSVHPITGTATR